MSGLNLCTYRRARTAYLQLSPRERKGMTPEKLLSLVTPCKDGEI